MRTGPIRQMLAVEVPDLLAVALDLLALFQLGQQEGCQDVRRQVARADIHPGVLVHLAAEETAAVGALFRG